MIEFVCDKCGKEISFEKTEKFFENHIITNNIRVDLCNDCYTKFVSWLNNCEDKAEKEV